MKTRRLKRSRRENALLLLVHRRRIWLVQRPGEGVWGGLWTLPEFPSVAALNELSAPWPGEGRWLPTVQHALTHFDWTLHPLRWQWGGGRAPDEAELPAGRWVALDEALALGLPAPVRRLLTAA